MTRTEQIKAAEDRAQRALAQGNEVAHRIHTAKADELRNAPIDHHSFVIL